MNYEKNRENLKNLIEWNKSYQDKDRNEATTRFHLIDRILLECLGWEKSDISTEENYNGQYTDYTLSLSRPTVILEAKREGNYFEIAEGKKGVIYSLKTLCKDNPKFKKAIEQACGYCNERGVEIAIVSNGWQIVAFVANRLDGVPPLTGNAIVFASLDKMEEEFLCFWNYLSKSGIQSKNLKNKLCGIVLPELPSKLSSSISYYPGIKNRNPFQANLHLLSELVLEDVLRYQDLEKTFLEECYCNAGALSNYATVSKEILRTRYENLFEENQGNFVIQSAVEKKGINQDFKNISAHSMSRRPILLIGDVGAGKSTFINHLIKVEAPDIFNDCITLKIDLGSTIVLSMDIREAILDEIIRLLLKEYSIDIYEYDFVHGIYHGEFQRFKKGIYKKYFDNDTDKALDLTVEFFESKQKIKSEHIKSSLFHLAKGRKKQIVIFLDNCDQRNYDTQQMAFLISQEITENWQPVTVFVSLRPETFHNSIKGGALSGYHPKAFTIAPPRLDLVIEKRLEFARKIANGEINLAQFEGSVGVNLSTLKGLIEVLIHSFENNDDLYRFIDNICNGNIRLGIDIVKNFLGSGHIDTEKIDRIYSEKGRYTIPLHEFLRAVIFGNNVHYDPESSYIVNVFDVHYKDEKEHFLLLIILSILESKATSGKDNGFIETLKLSNHLQALGFSIDQIDLITNIAISKKLIETSGRGATIDVNNLPTSLRITTMGSYHLNYLCNQFTYIDAIIVDTPIFDNSIRQEVQDTFLIQKRIDRARIFIYYLDEIWQDLENKPTQFNWVKISQQIKKDIDKVEAKVKTPLTNPRKP
ncbi:hypothetical protein [Flexithrix dorotheae]|uniref:hypothetical protein n=1 Tax=Flexithrix dorotheae TaxID=70993 RepID=UPI000373002C|nr:hypothetical protein [Flexithrix dorotheae]